MITTILWLIDNYPVQFVAGVRVGCVIGVVILLSVAASMEGAWRRG